MVHRCSLAVVSGAPDSVPPCACVRCPLELHHAFMVWIQKYERATGRSLRSPEEMESEMEDHKAWAEAANKNPFLAALYAEMRLTICLSLLILIVRTKLNLSDDVQIDYWVTPEWGKENGMRHDHIVLFVPGGPDLSFSEEELLADITGEMHGVPNLSRTVST